MDYERWEISPELEVKMRDVARQLRREPTPTEAILWEKLRRKQLGYKFCRQVPIGPSVVDFLCTATIWSYCFLLLVEGCCKIKGVVLKSGGGNETLFDR